ncbi:hypothetical protein Tco_0913696 [Tanacetum coccineum]
MKFNYTDVKSASTPVDLEKPLVKDGDADDVDVHLYRSMIGSLMYLTASRLDIIFTVCACARFQFTLKTSHLLVVKRSFRYLKGKPTLGLWYYKDSLFELVAYTDSDYARATQDRKSTTRAEYVAAASCCGHVLWIQNQLLDYRYNLRNTMIHIDNNNIICIIENPVQHSKTKHIEIRHHFIRDCNAKKLIQMVKIDTEHNVADLLTKGFDAGRHVKRGRDTKIPQSSGPPIKVGDEAVHKELGDRMERAATTASSLEAEQDSDAQTRFETTPKQSNDPPLLRVNTLRSGKDSPHYTTLTIEDEVRGITTTIDKKVKVFVSEASIRRHLKLEDSDGISSLRTAEIFEQLAFIGSLIKELDLDAEISLIPTHAADQGRIDDTQISDQPEEQLVSTADVSTASELGSTVGVKEKDKGKAIMQESAPPKKIKKRVQVQMSVDEELAKKVFKEEQAKFKAKQEQEKSDFETV